MIIMKGLAEYMDMWLPILTEGGWTDTGKKVIILVFFSFEQLIGIRGVTLIKEQWEDKRKKLKEEGKDKGEMYLTSLCAEKLTAITVVSAKW